MSSNSLLRDKQVLVLDGDDGIGEAVTAQFKAEGASVVSVQVSGTDVVAAFDQAASQLGDIDVVVNAISTWEPLAPESWTSDRWRDLNQRNGEVAMLVGQLALKRLRSPGVVCSVSSVWAMATSPEMGLFGASKAALGPITKAVALSGVSAGIRANTVVMGLIDTPALRAVVEQAGQAAGGAGSDNLFDQTIPRVPMRRAGTAEEVANAAAFLCSGHARMINGASVVVDGGFLYA